MPNIYKLKPEVTRFIISNKQKDPDISCRNLALITSKKFGIALSKSSVNNILIKEELTSPVGRKSKHPIATEGEIENGGFSMLRAVDHRLNISKTAARVLLNISPLISKTFLEDVENVLQALIFFKMIYDTNIITADSYDNTNVWQLVGKRPAKAVYRQILNVMQNSQLFANGVVIELKQRLAPISGFRFHLRDDSSFFIDASSQALWHTPTINREFITTYYNASSYVKEFIDNKTVFSIFNIQETSILSSEVLNFILAFEAQETSKRIKQIELINMQNEIVDYKPISGSDKILFLMGFWPWQSEMMSEFERKPAKQKFIWPEVGLEYYYQIEEINIPQHLVPQEVKLTAIILKNSPLAAARIGILTNIPRDIIHNYLSYKWLYHWFAPEERHKDFTKKIKGQELKSTYFFNSDLSNEQSSSSSLDAILEMLGKIMFHNFQQRFLSDECRSWNELRIKETFLKQKAVIKKSRDFISHKLIIDNKLCKDTDIQYICHRLNEAGIKDSQGKLFCFSG
ncbi:MAG: hypothetical protein PHS93_00075 [Candidatus Omnitrophica bacterium]|nr:hypothetical protein [Candidatus Omnitrophota bacterium]MDD5351558.1 hypothetical protein [Candidatus Omnitrophota bacterium]MDD5550993.1 hypothetical protein [Candidatus Omnitrophota bacterium]